MDAKVARWLRIKRYTPDQLYSLHRVEDAAEERWVENRGDPAKRGEGWLVAGVRFMDSLDMGLGKFWDPKKLDADLEVAVFTRAIYPIWGPIFAGGKHETELECVHAADLAIAKRGPYVNFGNVANGDTRRMFSENQS